MADKGEIAAYQPDEITRLEERVKEELCLKFCISPLSRYL